MPSGKLERTEDPHSAEKKREELKMKHLKQKVMDEMTPTHLKGEKGDPMDFPPEFDFLMKELDKKGGIRMNNLPELAQIGRVIYDSKDMTDEIKDSCYKVLTHLVNYSNLWIIHYNRHKKS